MIEPIANTTLNATPQENTQPLRTRPGQASISQVASTIAGLFLILAVGAYLRLAGLNWDDNHHLHPDERFLTDVTSRLIPVSSISEYLNTRYSTLNPNNVGFGFYVYGNFPIMWVRLLGEVVGKTTYHDVFLVGRVNSAVLDLVTIVMLFLIGEKLFDRRIGLLGAGLYACSALPIQLSHFYTVDIMTNSLVVMAFYVMVVLLDKHSWQGYVMFGILLGLAVASKISVFPLAGLLVLAIVIRHWNEARALANGDIKSAVHSAQQIEGPLGFKAGHGKRLLGSVVGLGVAGLVSIVAFRVAMPYAFLPPNSPEPIETEELGLLVGFASHIGNPIGFRPNPSWIDQLNSLRYQVSRDSDIPPNHQWAKRAPFLFPLANMVRIGMGWPLGIVGWLSVIWAVWEIVRQHAGSYRLVLPVTWILLVFLWQGSSWVMSMRYFLPIYPFVALLAGWGLIIFHDRVSTLLAARQVSRSHWPGAVSSALLIGVPMASLAWGFAVSRIYTRPVTRVEASHWMVENIPSDFTIEVMTPDGPEPHQLGLANNWLAPDSVVDSPAQPALYYSRVEAGAHESLRFVPRVTGWVSNVFIYRAVSPVPQSSEHVLRIVLSADEFGRNPLGSGVIVSRFEPGSDDARGQSYHIVLNQQVAVMAGTAYYLLIENDGNGPIVFSSATIVPEGSWDDSLPLPIPSYNIWGALYQHFDMEMVWEDNEVKRDRMQYVLDRADYLTISSNRFYDSLSRNPQRWPMSLQYYQALFSGALGFELVGDFTSRPNLGPIEFYDDEAEEAWTVYDHPRVFVFRKTERYSSENTAQILGSVDLSQVVRENAANAKGRPVYLERPDRSSWALLSSQTTPPAAPRTDVFSTLQPLGALLWWAAIFVLGLIAFPFVFYLFPGLRDRGYVVSRISGMLIVAWMAWFVASLGLLRWNSTSVWLITVLFVFLSGWVAFQLRNQLAAWLYQNRALIVLLEVGLAFLFLVFLFIRLGNPDLWHPAYGGEKPMDMAYFNAVLNTSRFPPYDPWFAGETINYYYFGFVLASIPVMLLGIPATLAYNLIIPTLYALTGGGAFAAVFNLLAASKEDSPEPTDLGSEASITRVLQRWPHLEFQEIRSALIVTFRPLAYVAGIPVLAGTAATFLTVVLGNLDQLRTLTWGLAELGAGQSLWSVQFMPKWSDTIAGLGLAWKGQPLPMGIGEWYWNATRLFPVPIGETGQPLEVGPITEFPLFTFLYADLHAHMMAMPLVLLALVVTIGMLRNAQGAQADPGITKRTGHSTYWIGVGFLGSMIVGALIATNTWDAPVYWLVICTVLILTACYARRDPIARNAAYAATASGGLVSAVIYYTLIAQKDLFDTSSSIGQLLTALLAGGLVFGVVASSTILFLRARVDDRRVLPPATYHWATLGIGVFRSIALTLLAFLFYSPYLANYRAGYTGFLPWLGSRTPVWAFVVLLGLFLFLIVSWLTTETLSWLKDYRQSGNMPSLRRLLVPVLIMITATGGLLYIAGRIVPIAVLSAPLALWAGLLFLRPYQSIEKQLVLILLLVAFSLTIVVEVFVLQGDIGRMNTVFKFYLQVWLLMAIAGAASLGWVWNAIAGARPLIRIGWSGGLMTLVFLAALYPATATRAKIVDRWSSAAPATLDGMAYMKYVERYENGVAFPLEGDYYALRWLQDNIPEPIVVLEGHTTEYRWGNRVSIYTGLPTVIGWNFHQRQQRPGQDQEVWERVSAVSEAYSTTDITRTMSILSEYDVELIVVGGLEHALYPLDGLHKFEIMAEQGLLDRIYSYKGTNIYRVIGGK